MRELEHITDQRRPSRARQNVIGKGIELNEAGGNCELMMETR